MLYDFFWVIPRLMNFIWRRFGTLSHFHRVVYSPMKMKQSATKRRHIKFKRRGTIQKKAHSIQNMAKV